MNVEEKYETLKNILKSLKSTVICYSGGVDSTLLLKAAIDTLPNDQIFAIIFSGPLFPKRETKEAKKIAESFSVDYMIYNTDIIKDEDFIKNLPERCYLCKIHLFEIAHTIREKKYFDHVLEGSNVDDLSDFRPGMKACKEMNVQSPLILAGLTKADIRKIAKHLSLPTADKPSSACLASRIPYGIKLNERILQMIDDAEEFLKTLGLNQLRARYHGDVVRIEVPSEKMERILKKKDLICRKLKKIGFVYITLDLEGYRSGSMNANISKVYSLNTKELDFYPNT